jgi:hypothetical protein
MKTINRICMLVITITFTWQGVTNGAVIEVGDLNIISAAGNPSNGLRYLDMTYSDGLTAAAALSNAQSAYPNARFATASEFNDLFAAAGISYNGALTAADGFTAGEFTTISSPPNYDGGVLASMLGYTVTTTTNLWTDPDGSADAASTRDLLSLMFQSAAVYNQASLPPGANLGWLLVSGPCSGPGTRYIHANACSGIGVSSVWAAETIAPMNS